MTPTQDSLAKRLLWPVRLASGLGAIGFSLLFGVLFLDPATIEKTAKGFVQSRIEREAREHLDRMGAPGNGGLAEFASRKLSEHNENLLRYRQMLRDSVSAKVAAEMARMLDLSCPCRKEVQRIADAELRDWIASEERMSSALSGFIRYKYMEVVANLTADLRIFLGANSALCILLLAAGLMKSKASAHLAIPGVLLLATILVSSSLYLFGQNWLFTIIYNDYVGISYLAYTLLLFMFILDVMLNHGKWTVRIANFLLDVFGSSFQFIPC